MVELKLCRRSELHGKNLVLAPAVVDAVEQVDVALYAPQLLFRLARRVDELGLVGAKAVNEAVTVILIMVPPDMPLCESCRVHGNEPGYA